MILVQEIVSVALISLGARDDFLTREIYIILTKPKQYAKGLTTSVFKAMTAAPLSDDEKVPKKPDIEEFISRLLKSDKFEQLADKIAEKAADKIITLQNLPRYADRARDDVTTMPTSTITLKTIDKKEKQEDDSDKETEENKSNEKGKKNSTEVKTDTDDQEDISEKPKIDTIAAMQKISKFPVAELSLNYKHFTTREKPISKTIKVTSTYKKEKSKENKSKENKSKEDKSKDDKSKKSHRKKTHSIHVDREEVFQRAQSIIESDSQAEPKEKIENESSESTDDEKERESTESQEKETVRKNKKVKKHKKQAESGSSSSQNDKSNSASNESEFTTQHKTKKSAIRKEDNGVDKTKSEKNDVGASVNKNFKSTIAFGYAENSQEDSDDNIVSNIANSAKFDEKMLNAIRTEMQDDKKEKKGDEYDDKDDDDNKKKDSDDDSKNDDDDNKKKEDIGDKNRDDEKIDTKHKIRENKGKKYAFAESPDYEEYHEQVANLLKSVRNDETKRNTVNEDLLDLMEPTHT